MQERIRETLAAHSGLIRALDELVPVIEIFAERAIERVAAGGRIFWMGNGGSAADSQHLAAELVGRFETERRAIASIALTTDTSILTSVGNDYGFDAVFARQVQALCRRGDLIVGISTSGNSRNVIAALHAARSLSVYRVGLTGREGGKILANTDLCIQVPSNNTARIQEAHILIGHIFCHLVETWLAGTPTGAPSDV